MANYRGRDFCNERDETKQQKARKEKRNMQGKKLPAAVASPSRAWR